MKAPVRLAVLLVAAAASGCAMREARPRDVAAHGSGPGPNVAAALRGGLATEGVDHDHDRDDELPPLPNPDAPAPERAPAGGPGGGAPPASRYASLDRATCEAELGRRKIGFDRVAEARGVVAPVRVTTPIGGVEFHSMLPASQRKTSVYEIYDCRLVLALDDYARILARHGIVEVVHYSVYRPPTPKAVAKGPGRRHSGALAIDLGWFKTRDGKVIDVEKDFHGRIGAKPCADHGPGGARTATPASGLPAEAATLRALVCEAADAQLFNVMLTPDYNWAHRNHFHFEVTAGVKWILVR